jgi:excinuclease ABC subunit C
VDALGEFLGGNAKPVLARLERDMQMASAGEEFEQAARLRDQLLAARRALETQEMVLDRAEDLDVIGMASDDLEAAFQVFFVRGGRVLGRKGWVVDRVEELEIDDLVASFVRQLYMEREEVPPRILVPALPSDPDLLEAWLGGRRGTDRGPREAQGPGCAGARGASMKSCPATLLRLSIATSSGEPPISGRAREP